MKNCINKIIFSFFVCFVNLNAEIDKVDILLEKVKQSSSSNEKTAHLRELKLELFKINKKAREDAAAILDAKKKMPSKAFNPEKIQK